MYEVPRHIMDRFHNDTEAKAIARRAERRTRYWLTALAIKTRAAKLREYVGKITADDIEFLRRDPNIVETVEDLIRLSGELGDLAKALSPDPEEVRLLADARAGIEAA
jgi:hypothetical protein